MTKLDLACCVVVIIACILATLKIISDIISKRITEYRTLLAIISIVFSIYASFGVAVITEYYCSEEFRLLNVCIYTVATFSIIFSVAVAIGVFKSRKNTIMDELVEIEPYIMPTHNDTSSTSNKIISFEVEKKKRASNQTH